MLWMCWSTFVRFSNYSLLSLSLSLFSGVALKRAFGFVGSACRHKSKREEINEETSLNMGEMLYMFV